MRDTLKLKNFSQQTAGNRATVDLPIGNIIHDVHLLFMTTAGALMTVAQMKSWVKNIKLILNGKLVQEFKKADYLFEQNGTNGAQYDPVAGHMKLYFSEPWRRSWEGEEFAGLGTGGLTTAVLEVEFDAAAVNPSVIGWASLDRMNRSVYKLPIKKVRTFNFAPAAAGTTQFDKLPQGPDIYYQRVHFKSALITAVSLVLDRNAKFEAVPLSIVAERFRNRGMVLQPNTYTMAFDDTQQLTDQVATFYQDAKGQFAGKIQDFRIDATASGAGNVDVIVEEWSYLER